MTMLYYQALVVSSAATEAVASPRKPLDSFLHRTVVQTDSPVKASPPRTSAQRRTTSPFTRSGRTRQMKTDNMELFDMSTQVTSSSISSSIYLFIYLLTSNLRTIITEQTRSARRAQISAERQHYRIVAVLPGSRNLEWTPGSR